MGLQIYGEFLILQILFWKFAPLRVTHSKPAICADILSSPSRQDIRATNWHAGYYTERQPRDTPKSIPSDIKIGKRMSDGTIFRSSWTIFVTVRQVFRPFIDGRSENTDTESKEIQFLQQLLLEMTVFNYICNLFRQVICHSDSSMGMFWFWQHQTLGGKHAGRCRFARKSRPSNN